MIFLTIRRDLQKGLETRIPGAQLLSIIDLKVRGNGQLDAMKYLDYADPDGDLIPDEIEVLGTDGDLTADADLDSDGLSNLREVIAGTLLDNADSDGDQLTDSFELFNAQTNPLLVDSDANGIDDAQEDPDSDNFTNLEKQTNQTAAHNTTVDQHGYIFDYYSVFDAAINPFDIAWYGNRLHDSDFTRWYRYGRAG